MSYPEIPKSGKVNITRVELSNIGPSKGPFTINNTEGFFPAIRFSIQNALFTEIESGNQKLLETALVPLPQTIIPISFNQPGRIESIISTLKYNVPLISYVSVDLRDDEIKTYGYGCITYPLQYEFTEDNSLRVMLEFNIPVRVIEECITEGEKLHVRVEPLAQKKSQIREKDASIANTILDYALSKIPSLQAHHIQAIQQIKSASDDYKLHNTAYLLCQMLELPTSTKLEVLSSSDISERLNILNIVLRDKV